MALEPLYLNFGLSSGRDVLARLREGRRRALASIETRFVVSCQQGGRVREVVFDRQPTAQDIVEKLGGWAIILGVDIQRGPVRNQPRMLD